MHAEVKEYITKQKEKYPNYFKNKRVLELGSLNYNGTPREFFENCEYIGIDHMQGDGVDVISKAHEFKSEPFDVVITTEMLEHDKYAKESLENAYRLLKNGGLLIATAANVGREPHYEFTGEDEHYENISKEFVISIFPKAEIEEDELKQDIRFTLIK